MFLRQLTFYLTLVILFNNQVQCSECGIRKSQTSSENLIVGGEYAKPGEFPWFVEIELNITEPGKEFEGKCGATLIRVNWALTAAHCVAIFGGVEKARYFTNYINITNLNEMDAKHRAKVIKVKYYDS